MRVSLLLPILLVPRLGPCRTSVRVEPPQGPPERVSHWQARHLHGPYRELYPDGTPAVEGAFAHGLARGTWIHRWPAGTERLRESFVDGLRDGPAGEWHEDGTPRSQGTWRAGDKDGVWTFFGPDGALVARETWELGTRVAIERF